MRKSFLVKILLLLLTGCSRQADQATVIDNKKIKTESPVKYYCEAIHDTFNIFISLPADYTPGAATKYPVIYLLDANLYFLIFEAIQKEYSKVGLLEPAILVGIGYKDFQTMDSLRDRDFTYPPVSPKDGFALSGNGDKFLSFITKDLVTDIEKKYPVDTNVRILMGHSLGAYFALYALQQNVSKKHGRFSAYIAASPYTHYYTNHILNELKKLDVDKQSQIKAYVTFGGLENEEEEDPSLPRAEDALLSLEKSFRNKITYKGDIYSNLRHMDMPLPSFIRGLQWTYYGK